jgi:hypothetical protein
MQSYHQIRLPARSTPDGEIPDFPTKTAAQFRDGWLSQVAANPEFTASDLATAITLAQHMNSQTHEAWPSIARMATLTGRSSRTINRSIKRLEGNGALAIKHSRGRRSNRYVLLAPTLTTLSGFNPASSVTDQGAQPCHQRHLNGDRAVSPEPKKEPMKEEKSYAWEGCVIRLTQPDFNKWRAAFPAIPDLGATLQKLDDYYSTHPPPDGKWFHRVSRCLAEENAKHAEKRMTIQREHDSW